MKDYMNLALQLNAFPTQFIINKDGSIAKVMSDYKSLWLWRKFVARIIVVKLDYS
jgi:hypothetical protein